MTSSTCSGCSCNPLLISTKSLVSESYYHRRHGGVTVIKKRINFNAICVVKASMVESSSSENSSNFTKRMEQAWLISQV